MSGARKREVKATTSAAVRISRRSAMAGALSVACVPQQGFASLASSRMVIFEVGNGLPVADGGAQPAALIKTSVGGYLFNAPHNVVSQLESIGAELSQLSGVLLTSLDFSQTAGLEALMLRSLRRASAGVLKIYGPPNTSVLVEKISNLIAAAPCTKDFLSNRIVGVDLPSGEKNLVEDNDLRVSSKGAEGRERFLYRVDFVHRRVIYMQEFDPNAFGLDRIDQTAHCFCEADYAHERRGSTSSPTSRAISQQQVVSIRKELSRLAKTKQNFLIV